MSKIKKVSEDLDLILESILQMDRKFRQVIEILVNNYDPIATNLYRLFNKDIKTNINFLNLGPANDEISFVNDTQVARILDAGGDPFSKSRNVQKVGRAVRQVLTSNGIEVTDKQIEEFVNRYKTEWDKLNAPINIDFVTGNEIKKWYLDVNYVSGSGQLNNSCMRYPATQNYLEIYTRNPEQCQLVILKTPDNTKLLGRALLWKCSEDSTTVARTPLKVDYYLDRIYTVFDHDRDKIKEFVKNKLKDKNVICHIDVVNDFSKLNRIKVSLENVEFAQYPYIDSLYNVYPNEKFISAVDDARSLVYQCRQTNGNKIVRNWVHSVNLNRYFPASEVIMVDSLRSYMPLSECLQDYQGRWIYRGDAIQSEIYGVITRRNAQQTRWGWVPNNELVTVYTNTSSTVAMPRRLLNIEFFECRNRNGSSSFGTEEASFLDVTGKRYLLADKRHLIASSANWEGLVKAVRIMSEDVKPLGNVHPSSYAPGVTYQLYSLPDSTLPIAIKYNYPPTERLVATYSFSTPVSPTASAPSTTSGVIALETDVNAFRLRKRRAARGTRSTDMWILKKGYALDYFLNHPITDKVISDTLTLIKVAGNQETTSAKMQLLADTNNYLYSQSAPYQRALKEAVLKSSTKESLYKEVNKNLENFWRTRDSNIRTYMSNMVQHLSAQRGQTAPTLLDQMLEDFNGRGPFETEKPLELNEFKQFLLEAREMFICQIYIWSLTRNRVLAGRTAARHYGFSDRRSAAYLSSWSYNRYSGQVGERVFQVCESFFPNSRFPVGNPIASMKCEAAYTSTDLLTIDKKTNTYKELLKAWDMFVKENFSTVFPPLTVPPIPGERLSKQRVRKFGVKKEEPLSPEERVHKYNELSDD